MIDFTLLFLNLGGGEIMLVLIVIVMFFGSSKIPELARGLGKGIREFKDATNGIQRDIQNSVTVVKEEVKEIKEVKE
jgi:sec-independent protein translocase protein TatA